MEMVRGIAARFLEQLLEQRLREGRPGPGLDPNSTQVLVYIDGRHYAVTGVRVCGNSLEIEYNHSEAPIAL